MASTLLERNIPRLDSCVYAKHRHGQRWEKLKSFLGKRVWLIFLTGIPRLSVDKCAPTANPLIRGLLSSAQKTPTHRSWSFPFQLLVAVKGISASRFFQFGVVSSQERKRVIHSSGSRVGGVMPTPCRAVGDPKNRWCPPASILRRDAPAFR